MKKFRITKIVSLALAAVIAVSTFSFSSQAASRADEYRRDLTQAEVQALYSIFDAEFYAKANADVMDYYGFDYYTSDCDQTLFAHFLACGLWEERQPNALINIDVYATRNIDLRAAYGDDIVSYYVHYATHPEEVTWRATPTLGDAYLNGITVYSVYDMVQGSTSAVKAGALPVQTVNYAPVLGIGTK